LFSVINDGISRLPKVLGLRLTGLGGLGWGAMSSPRNEK
jgi:hypothetical protein